MINKIKQLFLSLCITAIIICQVPGMSITVSASDAQVDYTNLPVYIDIDGKCSDPNGLYYDVAEGKFYMDTNKYLGLSGTLLGYSMDLADFLGSAVLSAANGALKVANFFVPSNLWDGNPDTDMLDYIMQQGYITIDDSTLEKLYYEELALALDNGSGVSFSILNRGNYSGDWSLYGLSEFQIERYGDIRDYMSQFDMIGTQAGVQKYCFDLSSVAFLVGNYSAFDSSGVQISDVPYVYIHLVDGVWTYENRTSSQVTAGTYTCYNDSKHLYVRPTMWFQSIGDMNTYISYGGKPNSTIRDEWSFDDLTGEIPYGQYYDSDYQALLQKMLKELEEINDKLDREPVYQEYYDIVFNETYTGDPDNPDIPVDSDSPGGLDSDLSSIMEKLDEIILLLEKNNGILGDIEANTQDIKTLLALEESQNLFQMIASKIQTSEDILKTRFPSSIPWDVAAVFEVMSADPKPPVFDIPISVKSLGITETIHIDLSESSSVSDMSKLSKLSRSLLTATFVLYLILLSKKIFGGDD